MAGASGKKLDETYKFAWLRGLKTTYYLRTMGATHAEKSTINSGQLNAVSVEGGMSGAAIAAASAASAGSADITVGCDVKFCSIDDPECEACQ
jgi:ribonucleoside-diphosphate reductase alpha chain